MPTEIAAQKSVIGNLPNPPNVKSMASTRATKAPVMDAVRVPPSAWITSQSTVMERSPKAFKSTTARNARPIKR